MIKEFTHNEKIYQAYIDAITKPQYYIYCEEIRFLAQLSNRTIKLWYREINGIYANLEFQPNEELTQWIKNNLLERNTLLFDDKDPIEIYHDGFISPGVQGNYFSRANATVINKCILMTNKTSYKEKTVVNDIINLMFLPPNQRHAESQENNSYLANLRQQL